MRKGLNILSLFDGISCARLALDRAGFVIEKYYASEIDKYAIAIAQHNFPDTISLSSVVDLHYDKVPLPHGIDLLIGGSPCQDLSIAKKGRKGLGGDKSGLFWEYVRILKEVNPKYFVLENVASMPKEAKEMITKTLLKIYPDTKLHAINANLVSAQNRKRFFRTNIQGVTQPEDRGIFLKDVLEGGANEIYQVPRGFNKGGIKIGKSPTLTSCAWEQNNKLIDGELIRKLTPIECERLQGVPDNYTLVPHPTIMDKLMSNTQRYKTLGSAFNVDVVAHILSFIYKN